MAFLKFNKSELVNLAYSLKREIICANKTGAYCNTSIVTCNTRRYHGLLAVTLDRFGGDRFLLLSSLDESLVVNGKQFNLGIHCYGESYEELNESLKVNLKLDLNISAFKLNLNGTFGKNTLSSSKRVFSWMRGIYEQRLVRMNVTPIAAQNNSLFTQDFAEERQRVIDAGGSDASIRQLLSRYGTHYVTTSTLGGYLDYYFSSSVDKISDTLDVDATIGFGYATTFNLNADVKYKDAFESFGEDKIESFLVKGGDAITLTNAVVAKTISNAALDAWLASFGGVEDDQGRLELINFEVNGIYELFPSDIKTKIRNYIERVMYYNDLPVTRSGNQDSFQN